jgi:putative ABC transport system substrate-binding protein
VPKPVIGLLAVSEAESIDALTEALAHEGWIGGRDYELLMPSPSSEEAILAANMDTILGARVDLVIAQTKPAARVAVKATREVPIVLGAFNGNPQEEGIVRDLDRPGGNVTGTYYLGRAGVEERLSLLAELTGRLERAGVLVNARSAFSRELGAEAQTIAARLNVSASALAVVDASALDTIFAHARTQNIDGIVTVTGADMYAMRGAIAAAAWKHRVPVVMGSIGFPELGGLAKLGPDIPVLWRKMAAAHVIPILEGAGPGELPLIGLAQFELVINLAAAGHLGVSVSQSLQSRATKLVRATPVETAA